MLSKNLGTLALTDKLLSIYNQTKLKKRRECMKKNVWAKTILSVYFYLEKITIAIDKIIDMRVDGSKYYSKNAFNDIMTISNHILSLTERKVKLINLKVLCEKALESMPEDLARIVVLAFIEKRNANDSAKSLGISVRNYFRKMPQALKSFESFLAQFGYTQKKLEQVYGDEILIVQAKNKIIKDKIFRLDKTTFDNIYKSYKFDFKQVVI